MNKPSKKYLNHFKKKGIIDLVLSFKSYLLSFKGFSLVELLIVFLVGSIVVSIGVNSISTYNNTQVFNQSVSKVFGAINNTKSRAISQVKPSACGSNTLIGFEFEIIVSSGVYQQNAVCGAARILLNKDKISTGINFLSGSNNTILFKVGKGTSDFSGSIGLTGFGKTSTINVNKTGVITINEGSTITPHASPSPTPSNGPTAPHAPSSIRGITWYSDGANSKSGSSGSTITVFATNTKPSTVFDLVAGTDGGNSGSPCSQNIRILAASRFSSSSGFISHTNVLLDMIPGTWQICFKEDGGSTVTNPVIFNITSAENNPTPTPTSGAPSPTPTPPSGSIGSTSIRITSISPNPATQNNYENMIFSAEVTGTNCTPIGRVEFFKNNETTRFTAGSLNGSNPATANGNTNSANFTIGTHEIYARFFPHSGNCPQADSAKVTLGVD